MALVRLFGLIQVSRFEVERCADTISWLSTMMLNSLTRKPFTRCMLSSSPSSRVKLMRDRSGNGKDFSKTVDSEKGGFESVCMPCSFTILIHHRYLMYADLDWNHPEVQQEVIKWAVWIQKELGCAGFRCGFAVSVRYDACSKSHRMDAIKHFSISSVELFMKSVREQTGVPLFGVGAFSARSKFVHQQIYAQASTGKTTSRPSTATSTGSELNSASLTHRRSQ